MGGSTRNPSRCVLEILLIEQMIWVMKKYDMEMDV